MGTAQRVVLITGATAGIGKHTALHLRERGLRVIATGRNQAALDALRLLGGRFSVIARGDRAGHEPIAELQVGAARVRGGVMGGEVALRCADSLPALCLLGARSLRGLAIADAESYAPPGDAFWPQLAQLVRSFGAACETEAAGLAIQPALRCAGARVDAREDRRLALTAVIFGLAAEGETLVDNASCLLDAYPELLPVLQRLGASVRAEEAAA